MRYAIFSDVHGNLEAFDAVLKDCKDRGVRRYFCVGDTIGYGPNPHECLLRLKEIKAAYIAGNHEWALAGKLEDKYLNSLALEAINWTRAQLNEEERALMDALPLVVEHDTFQMVHGSLNDPDKFRYLNDTTEALDTFYLMTKQLCFIGHTHVPRIFVRHDDVIEYEESLSLHLNDDWKYLINVGSVGQPRDGDPRACYCVFDPELKRVELKKVSYDSRMTHQKILEAGLPEMLARRLLVGQ